MSLNGCADLWREVLILTITDALYGVRQSDLRKPIRLHATKASRDYLIKPNRDFDTVCYLAGIDPDEVRARLCIAIADALSMEEVLTMQSKKPRIRCSGRCMP